MSEDFVLPTGKKHISFSELREWAECSYRHKLRHIDKIQIDRPSYHLVFGSAVHNAIEHFLNTKEVKPEIAHNYIDEHWNEAFAEPKDKKFSKEKLKEEATGILEDVPAFLDEKFPGWEMVAAEQSLYEAIDASGATFKGFIDCVLKIKDKKGDDQFWIIDWKTSGGGWAPKKKSDPLTKLQLVLYKNFWLQKKDDKELGLKNVRCAFVVLKRKGKAGKRCDLIPVSVGEVTVKKGLKIVTNMFAALGRGIHLKNRNNCQWCDFRDTEHCP